MASVFRDKAINVAILSTTVSFRSFTFWRPKALVCFTSRSKTPFMKTSKKWFGFIQTSAASILVAQRYEKQHKIRKVDLSFPRVVQATQTADDSREQVVSQRIGNLRQKMVQKARAAAATQLPPTSAGSSIDGHHPNGRLTSPGPPHLTRSNLEEQRTTSKGESRRNPEVRRVQHEGQCAAKANLTIFRYRSGHCLRQTEGPHIKNH
ncbi:hypothetical protein KIN20_023642 [Parelaphostrongylus tenuis]|uniref:Uncharacterized protein n=1 Tax=Parelaphostrongylus tenuis TaxID=148309 RepID=A0AAD5MS10_PARTN|nr:hypothetical protein KIN20_023642 [Parelaphostrongylus tenuis]